MRAKVSATTFMLFISATVFAVIYSIVNDGALLLSESTIGKYEALVLCAVTYGIQTAVNCKRIFEII